jgi:hypothetical protein
MVSSALGPRGNPSDNAKAERASCDRGAARAAVEPTGRR